MNITEGFALLTKPLTADEVEWRVQASTKSRSDIKTQLAPYINSRAVQNRFDAAFGPLGWQNALRREGNDAWVCGIAVKNQEGEWVWKWDGAGASNIEPVKGGISGAIKRAAGLWGLGRELYDYPKVYIVGEHGYVPYKVLERLTTLPKAMAEKRNLPRFIVLDAEGNSVKK